MRVIEAFDIYRFYHVEEEETLALRGVSLYVDPGEIVAVKGPSGSGKSTLLACLSGLDEPDGGYVVINGDRLTRKSEVKRAQIRARMIGIMLQSGNLLDHLSVEDNIRLQMHLAGKIDMRRLDSLIETVGLQHRRHARPAHISGGEAARAGLAVAMAANPVLLLADEPTSEVDADTEKQILHLLDDYRKNGNSVLVVTHSDALAKFADRTMHLLDGRIVNNG
jgi:putative ABC transport system ATP-binding protein